MLVKNYCTCTNKSLLRPSAKDVDCFIGCELQALFRHDPLDEYYGVPEID